MMDGQRVESAAKPKISLNTRLVWIVMLVMAGGDTFGLMATGLSLEGKTFYWSAFAAVGLLGVSALYVRRDHRISALAHMAAIILVFTGVASVASYLSVVWHQPLIDDGLIAADHAICLNWPAIYGVVAAHRGLHIALIVAYYTLIPQMVILLVLLNFLGRIGRAWELIWMFIISCIGCLVVSAIWPAVGAFAHFHVELTKPYIHAFASLRDGTMKIIGHERIEGLITFPSLHAALAIIYAYAARGIRFVFPTLAILNTLVFIATPIVGGHHFADLWGGIVITIITIFAAGKLVERSIAPNDRGLDIDKAGG